MIGIYQAGYQLVKAQLETTFTSGVVNASLPIEYRTTKTPASLGGHQNFSKRVMSVLPITNSNNYGFSYIIGLSSGPKPASMREMASLPIKTKPSGFTLVGKGAVVSLP